MNSLSRHFPSRVALRLVSFVSSASAFVSLGLDRAPSTRDAVDAR